jgi:prophage maintenance system killer protein
MNGYKLAVDADEAERFLVRDVIVGRAEVADISAWLEKFLVTGSK